MKPTNPISYFMAVLYLALAYLGILTLCSFSHPVIRSTYDVVGLMVECAILLLIVVLFYVAGTNDWGGKEGNNKPKKRRRF